MIDFSDLKRIWNQSLIARWNSPADELSRISAYPYDYWRTEPVIPTAPKKRRKRIISISNPQIRKL